MEHASGKRSQGNGCHTPPVRHQRIYTIFVQVYVKLGVPESHEFKSERPIRFKRYPCAQHWRQPTFPLVLSQGA